MKKQIPAMVLAIACIGLLIFYSSAQKTIKELQQRVAQLEKNIVNDEPIVITTPAAKEKTPKEIAQEIVTVDPIVTPSSIAPEPEPLVTEPEDEGRQMMKNIAKMMDNPSMNKIMEATQRGQLEALYSDLMDILNLNNEEKEFFTDLLLHRQMALTDYAMKAMSESMSEEEQEDLANQTQETSDMIRDEIKYFLNDSDDFEEYEFYEKTMTERMALSQLDEDLAGTGEMLSDETYRELLSMMHDERSNFEYSGDLQDEDNMNMSADRLSKENVQNLKDDMRQLNDSIFNKAQSMLSETQYESFVTSVNGMTEMQLAQLEMAAQLLGGGE